MTRPAPQPPEFRVVKVPGAGDRAGHLVLWCPWCERVHRHGAAGGAGNRAAHCHGSADSPLSCTGYDLDVVGSAANEAKVKPDGLMVGGNGLASALEGAAYEMRLRLLGWVLHLPRPGRDVISKRLLKGRVWVFGRSRWLIERATRPTVEGKGLLHLMATLYGVSPGVAAVRVLEAVTAETLDAEAALAVQQAIDDWSTDGAPQRGVRP